MAVLQIQSSPKPLKRQAVGIDLGTTHSLVACDIEGQIQILEDEQGEVLLPSVVRYLPEKTCIVGKEARAFFTDDPQNTIISVKRLMGRSPKDIDNTLLSHIMISDPTASTISLQTVAGKVDPIQVSAQILSKLMERVHHVDATIDSAVITVPAYFDEGQRQATKDAARLAGIKVLRLLNEPTAAAIAYGLDKGTQGHCLIFDLGGGTFDVSILALNQGIFEVLATGGDTALGGDDIDHCLANWIIEKSGALQNDFPEILVKARLAKEQLSTVTRVAVALKNGWQGEITVSDFNALIEPLIDKTLKICQQVLRDAKISKEATQHIILVGGSTRIPYLHEKVEAFFGKPLLTDICPDKVVAMGAAVQASLLIGNRRDKEMLLLDVTPLSLGLEMMGGAVEKIIPRNMAIPAEATQVFTTFVDNQTALSLHVLQGEREMAEHCRSLAKFDLTGIPLMSAGKARIEVTFRVDADGLLFVQAKELTCGIKSDITVKPTYGLTPDAVNALIEAAIMNADEDVRQRKLSEKIQEAQHLLASLERAFSDVDLLTSEQHTMLIEKVNHLREILKTPDLQTIQRALKALEKDVQLFSELRLNAALQKVFEGKTLSEIEQVSYD